MPFQLPPGEYRVGEYVAPSLPDHFSGRYYLDRWFGEFLEHAKCIRLVTDCREQAQKICDLLNSNDISVPEGS